MFEKCRLTPARFSYSPSIYIPLEHWGFERTSVSPIQFTHKYTPFVCPLFYPAHVIVQFTHSRLVPSIHAHAWSWSRSCSRLARILGLAIARSEWFAVRYISTGTRQSTRERERERETKKSRERNQRNWPCSSRAVNFSHRDSTVILLSKQCRKVRDRYRASLSIDHRQGIVLRREHANSWANRFSKNSFAILRSSTVRSSPRGCSWFT